MGRHEKAFQRGGRPPALAVARTLWEKRRFDEALRKFSEAVRQAPNDPATLIEASRALAARYEVDRSVALLQRASRLAPRRADVQHAIGETYRILGRPDSAETHFRSACRLGPLPQSQLELAKICERRHALDEAEELVSHVLRSEPRNPAALLLQARVQRRRGDFDKAQESLRRLTSTTAGPPKIVAEACGELCTLLDAVGQYDAAWDAILKCKQILLAHDRAAWDAAQFVLARCRRMVDALTPAHFERWQTMPSGASPQRLALLTGFPRSGTTLLEQMLDAHPDVVSSEEKEVFSAEVLPLLGEGRSADWPLEALLDELTDPQVCRARHVYLHAMQAMLGEPIGPRLHLDKNPAMNLMIPAMRRVFPELKLVIALRDPRDVIVSCFLRYLPVNPVSVCFLTLERTAERYALDARAWLKMREMIGDWIEVRYEGIVLDLERQAHRVLDALGVPWDAVVLRYRGRAQRKHVASPSYEEIAQPIFTTSVGRWQNYERHLAPALAALGPLLEVLGYEK